MNPEFVKKALEEVLNPNILVNLVSRRVRQLTAGARPLLLDTVNLGAADIALLEIIEHKMGFEMPEFVPSTRPAARNRRTPQGWAKPQVEKRAA
jgi:DNA-directed RNA polymerase subunit omega